jgi:dipeptidase E
MRLLLISNSTNAGEEYLSWCINHILEFLGAKPLDALFIPYAAVTFGFDEYESKVAACFAGTGIRITSIHHAGNPAKAVEQAKAIIVGGGNTWQLVRKINDNRLMATLRRKVRSGTPYIGWSAGSNIASPTLRTTNDMPIINLRGFKTLNLIPFQINPHYLDAHPKGHGGETREQRILEFIEINPTIYVIGLREGTLLLVEDKTMQLKGNLPARLFKKGEPPRELQVTDNLIF